MHLEIKKKKWWHGFALQVQGFYLVLVKEEENNICWAPTIRQALGSGLYGRYDVSITGPILRKAVLKLNNQQVAKWDF